MRPPFVVMAPPFSMHCLASTKNEDHHTWLASGNLWRRRAERDSLRLRGQRAGRMSAGQPGFWDVQDRLREVSAQGDPLEKLAATVDFEIFRAELAAALGARDGAKGGRPAFDPVLKFRMLVLQAMHGL